MFQFQGIWLPDGEKHFPAWMAKNGEMVDGKGTYQIKKWRACLPHIKQFRVAVDVGGHVGFWTSQFLKRFEKVHAFEPVAQFRECLAANVREVNKLELYAVALGAKSGEVFMSVDPADSGGTHVERMASPIDDDPAIVSMRTLDSYAFQDVDFMKLDCEGYELEVLKGAAETLKRCKPTIIVEQKPHKLSANYGTKGKPAVDFLLGLGYTLRREIGGDFILS
jgi:FkbM family methyltransferase